MIQHEPPTPACPAVLLLGFNRPDLVKRTMASIAAAAPARFYVACDGARPERPDESNKVAAVQKEMLSPNWTCTVKNRFLDTNYGCRKAVSDAIDWFFEHESAGIILEDDCVADLSFFRFTGELLQRYEHDERVGSINGSAFAPRHLYPESSYSFSRYPNPWGWATWRRAWARYDREPRGWRQALDSPDFIGTWCNPRAGHKWRRRVMSAFTGAISTWDYQWHYAMWRHQMLAISPACNLITNVGFTADAIHTNGASPWADLPTQEMVFPLRHPALIAPDDQVDRFLEQRKFKSGPLLTRHLERMRWKLGWMSLEEARGCQVKRS